MEHNLVGKRFCKLIVNKKAGYNKRKEALWSCLCDCGNIKKIKSYNLVTGHTKSCGCINTGPKIEDIKGKKFNHLTVISYEGRDKGRISLWKCLCDCGNYTIIRRTPLIKGTVKSCGCWKKERLTGSNNPLWNPNLTYEQRSQSRGHYKHRKWANKVKDKFENKCIICSKNKSLVSHHLDSYMLFPDKRFEIDNGVCLCRACHKDFHSLYKYGNNTRKQFVKFMRNKCHPSKLKLLK